MASQTAVNKLTSSTKRFVSSLENKAKRKGYELDMPVILGGIGAVAVGGIFSYFSKESESRIIWWTKWLLLGGGALTTVSGFAGKGDAQTSKGTSTITPSLTQNTSRQPEVIAEPSFKKLLADYASSGAGSEAEETLIKNPDRSITEGLVEEIENDGNFAPEAAEILVKRCYGENSVTDGFSYNAEGILLKALEEGHETVKTAIAQALCEVPVTEQNADDLKMFWPAEAGQFLR